MVRQMWWRWRVLCIVVSLRLTGMRQDVLEFMALEFVVVVLELVLVGLHLAFVVLQRRLQLLLEVGLGLSLHLPTLSILLRHLLLLLSLVLNGGSHHGRKALGQLGGQLQLICADGRAGVLLLRRGRVLKPLELVQFMVLMLFLVLRDDGKSVVLRLGGLMVHLWLQVAMLGELLIVLCLGAVDHGGRVALLHDGIPLLWIRLLVVHDEAGASGPDCSAITLPPTFFQSPSQTRDATGTSGSVQFTHKARLAAVQLVTLNDEN
jgi:hypothetical protein